MHKERDNKKKQHPYKHSFEWGHVAWNWNKNKH